MDGFLSRQLGKEAEPDGGWLSQLIPDGSGNGLRSSVPASGPGWDALGRQATPTLGNGIRLAGGAVWGGRYPRIPVIEPPETGPGSIGWHDYHSGPNFVCGMACSAQAIAEYLSRFAYPGQDPAYPVGSSSENNLVEDPWDHIPGGLVKTEISKDGLTVTNTTEWLHPFYKGQVVRTARLVNGGWYVTTRGFGNNRLPGMAEINQENGPKIFDEVDRQMQAYIAADANASNRPY